MTAEYALRGERYAAGCRTGFVDQLREFRSEDAAWLDMPSRTEDDKKAREARAAEAFAYAKNWYGIYAESLDPAERALLGCNDRFFLLTNLLKRSDATHPWLYARCREVEADPDDHLDLWARWHWKSSIITNAGSIQEIVSDPEITIGIFAVTNPVAKPFLKQIKSEFEKNEELKATYPDVLWANPRRDAPVWSLQEGITVRRKSNPKECTVEAYGLVDAEPTGRHFRLLIYDDLVTKKSVTNEDMIRKTTEAWELSTNLGSGESTRRWHIGTRYHFGDTWGQMLERGSVKPRLYPATHNGRMDGTPVFMSQAAWDKVKRDQRSTAPAQMLQNPLAGKEATFRSSMLRGYEVRPSILNVYIMGDPSMGRTKKSDRTALVAIGVDANKNKYLLDGYCHRMSLTDRWNNLKNLYVRWVNAPGVKMVKVGYERYGLQSDIEHFEDKMQGSREEPQFKIHELSWTKEGNESKKSRVQRLEPDFSNTRFFLPAKVYHPNVTWWTDRNGGDHIGELPEEERLRGGVQHTLPRVCLWAPPDEGGVKLDYRPVPLAPSGLASHTKAERAAISRNARHLIIPPIKRVDENDHVYDLTRMFFEEFMFFPFSTHDDLIDCVSRIYDMEIMAPEIINERFVTTPHYPD